MPFNFSFYLLYFQNNGYVMVEFYWYEPMYSCWRPNKIKDLSEYIFLHILSSMETKEAIQRMCDRSQNWKDNWKMIRYLNFNNSLFRRTKNFDNFVRCVLSEHGSSPIRVLIYHRYRVNKTNHILLKEVILERFAGHIWNLYS